MASQFGEEKFILEYFAGRPGRFLDVGAGDGRTFSNTAPLLGAGWSGVMIEPALDQLRWLLQEHGSNTDVDIVPGVLTPSNCRGRNWELYWDGRDFSSAVASHVEKILQHSQGTQPFRPRFAPTLTWRELQRMYPQDFQFINIDVEGWNEAVLADCPILASTEMVCIEIDPADNPREVRRILDAAGLNDHKEIGGNLLACR